MKNQDLGVLLQDEKNQVENENDKKKGTLPEVVHLDAQNDRLKPELKTQIRKQNRLTLNFGIKK